MDTENPCLNGLGNSDKVSANHQRITSLTYTGITRTVNGQPRTGHITGGEA